MRTSGNRSNADVAPTIGATPAMPAHDKGMAGQFLACLDPAADRFTFQFFGDGPGRYAEVFHGTLEQAWAKVLVLNTPECRTGVFVTICETDAKGRREANILRPRALFVDADTPAQIASCIDGIEAAGATPSMVVETGRGKHFYWLCPDVPRDQFSALQKRLIDKLGTDKAIHDLPRVMRLPGTLHLKDEAQPRPVKLYPLTSPPIRWGFSELVAKFGALALPRAPATAAALPNNVVPFKLPEWAINGRPAAAFAHLPLEKLGDDPDIEKIRSAIAAVPASAIALEPEWVKLARALGHEAAAHKDYAEELWEILDSASRGAPGYNHPENRERFERFMREAFNRPNPITIATLFHMAKDHGWTGLAASPAGPTNSASAPMSSSRAVHISNIPLVPSKRQWLHGTDLVRGAVTVLVAPGGRAKSTWLLACALSCASGRDLLGSHVFGGPLRVLCLSTEDGLNELALRLRAAMKHYKLADTDVPGLHVIGADHWGLPLLKMDSNRAVLDQAGTNALALELDHVKPDVLILDPLINLLGGVNGNDNAAAALLMRQLVGLAITRRMAIALAHHVSKGRDPASAESAMGAASFTNLARIALSIEPLEEKNAGTVGLPPWEARSVFRLLGTKHNLSPPKAEDRWFRLVSVTMANAEPPIYMSGDQVAVVEPFQPGVTGSAFPDALVRDALLAVDRAGPPLTPSARSHERYAAPVIADAIKHRRAGQASEMDGKAVLDHLMSAGLVAVAEVKVPRGGKGSDIRKGLVLTGAGKVALQQAGQTTPTNPTPQSPQRPATTMHDDAGGDAPAAPATQGGCGGNAGEDINAVNRAP